MTTCNNFASESEIAVLGGIITDFICYIDKEPSTGETVLANDFKKGFGGKGANQCVMAARLGGACSMLGKVGDDSDGKDTIENFRAHAIQTQSVITDPCSHTGVALISVEETSGQNRIIVGQGVNKLVDRAFIKSLSPTIIGCQVMLAGMEVDQEAVVECMKIAKNAGKTTILNPAPVPAWFDPELFMLSDYFCPNETEAALLVGKEAGSIKTIEDANQCVKCLRSKGAKTVIMTFGGKGCIVLEEGVEIPFHVEAPCVEKPVDTTGAGDAFCGSFAYYVCKFPQLSLKEKVSRSCIVASISVQQRGTQKSFPYRRDISQHLFE